MTAVGLSPTVDRGVDRSWWADARCATTEPEVMFPDGRDLLAVADALRICQGCPVAAECDAAGVGERFGVWAGRLHLPRGRGERSRHPVDLFHVMRLIAEGRVDL